MKKQELIRTLFICVSYLAFLPFAFFLYNGRNGIYYAAYSDSVRIIDSMSVQLTILYAIFIGLGVSALIQIGRLFFTPEGRSERRSPLLGLSLSDALTIPYLLTYLCALICILLLSHGKIGLLTVVILFLLLWGLHVALLLLPPLKEVAIPDPVSASTAKSDALLHYSRYLRKLTEKADSPALRDVMLELAELLDTVDPVLSDEIDALEAKLSAECISIENAILAGSGSKITLLTRELIDLTENIKNRIAAASLTVRGQRFEEIDNEIAEGLIDKILDEMNVDDEEQIVNRDVPLDTDLRFVKALRFADPEYREILEGYNRAIRNRLTRKKKEENARRSRIVRIFRKVALCSFCLLGTAMLISVCIRAFVTQPGGFLYREVEMSDGSVALEVIGYNRQFGKKAEIPAEIRGKAVRTVGKRAFWNERGISEIIVPEGVTSIDIHAFAGAENLKTLYLPASLEYIYGYAFDKDYGLTIHYASDSGSWENILVQTGNTDALKSATIYYNSSYEP